MAKTAVWGGTTAMPKRRVKHKRKRSPELLLRLKNAKERIKLRNQTKTMIYQPVVSKKHSVPDARNEQITQQVVQLIIHNGNTLDTYKTLGFH